MKLKNIFLKLRGAKDAIEHPFCSAVIVAAGSATRMQGCDKITATISGKPVLWHTVNAFENCALIDEIIVVGREDKIGDIKLICKDFSKVSNVVCGGASRPESVLNGLNVLDKHAELAAIHDGARPLVTDEVIAAACRKAAKFGAAAPAISLKDTVKFAYEGVVDHTPDRGVLFAIQTPQVFDADLLRGALYKAVKDKLPITDDCSAIEAIGAQVHLTQGSEENIKITTPLDLKIAEMLFAGREEG